MNIKKKNISKKQTLILIISGIAVVFIVVFGYMFIAKTGLFRPIASVNSDNTSLSPEEKTAGTSLKEQASDNASKNTDGTGSDPLPAPTPSTNNTKPTVGVEITFTNQDSSTLHIGVLAQTVSSSGTCSLSMKATSGKTYSQQVDVQALPSATTCKGFDIPLSSLSKETWSVTLNYEDSSVVGKTSQEVVVQ